VIGALLAAASSFAILAVAFVPLERGFAARPTQRTLRPALAIDACFFLGQYLAFTGISVALLTRVAGLVDATPLPQLFDRVPPLARIVGGVLLGDVLVYWFHRACHRFEFLWRFHAVHHSSEHLDWLAAHREHPVDGILTQLCQNLPIILLAAPIGSIAWLAAFRGIWAIFVHSNVRLPLGPLRFLFGAPELHHWHHAKAKRTEHNFANLAPWIDWVFGTHHLPELPETFELGLGEPHPRGYFALLLAPFGLGRVFEAAIDRLVGRAGSSTMRATPDPTGAANGINGS
jgi:sterol desaturase/sphingolipid hydroxylase (fatty acid hydroxylase superfamily)